MRHLLTQTCEILRATLTTSGFGTKSATRTWPTSGPTHPCRLQLSGGTEDRDLRDVAIREGKVFLPPDADVTVKDRLIADGSTFEILTVYPVRSPQGLHHFELTVRTFSGGVPSV